MHHHAAKTAATPHVSLNAFSAPSPSYEERNGCDQPSFDGAIASRSGLRFERTSAAEWNESDSVQWVPSASYPVLCSGSRFGPIRRPAAGSLFCFGYAALRVTVSVYDGPSVNAELRPWEAGPLAWLRLV